MGSINKLKIPKEMQFSMFSNEKLRMALIGLADKLDARARAIVYQTYNDPVMESLYRGIRASKQFEAGSKVGAHHRKILEFPNREVWDFCNTAMTALYGRDWLDDNKALKHELILPWWVINKL
jgi:hypothetical protein